jgi:hypothetical protein
MNPSTLEGKAALANKMKTPPQTHIMAHSAPQQVKRIDFNNTQPVSGVADQILQAPIPQA